MSLRNLPVILIVVLFTGGLAFVAMSKPESPADPGDGPRFTQTNQMVRPDNYREWIWLSSGLGMSYTPGSSDANPDFDNVFVNPSAYRSFLTSGKWPDKTVLVLEVRQSVNKGSINQNGHYQSALEAVEVHVKDGQRFPGQWAFFGFDGSAKTASMIPTTAGCYSCHQQHGAVDTTFAQFYPTVLEIAKQKGTVRAQY